MKEKSLISAVLVFALGSMSAQDYETKKAYSFSNINEIGFVSIYSKGVNTHSKAMSLAFEASTINGFSVNNEHHWGLGIGIGIPGIYQSVFSTIYVPLFANYRFYFVPEKRPHYVNLSLGGLKAKNISGFHHSQWGSSQKENFHYPQDCLICK